MLAGGLVLVSFMMLYQDRSFADQRFCASRVVLALSVAWQAYIQDAHHLYVTAAIALVFKAIVIPVGLHRIIQRSSASIATSRPPSASVRPCLRE